MKKILSIHNKTKSLDNEETPYNPVNIFLRGKICPISYHSIK